MRFQTPRAAMILVALLAALWLAAGDEAIAGGRQPFFGIGIHGNYFNTSDADDGSIRPGIQVRLRFTEKISLEGSADYRDEQFDGGQIEVDGYPFQLSGLWYIFGRGGVNPHLIFGGSWYNSEITLNQSGGLSQKTTSSDFGYHGGFGLELHLTERSFFHGDVRYQFLDVDYLGTSVDHDGFMVQAGLTFYF